MEKGLGVDTGWVCRQVAPDEHEELVGQWRLCCLKAPPLTGFT